jgi:hypothetical protein
MKNGAKLFINENFADFLTAPGPFLEGINESVVMEVALKHFPTLQSHLFLDLTPTFYRNEIAVERFAAILKPRIAAKLIELCESFGAGFHD